MEAQRKKGFGMLPIYLAVAVTLAIGYFLQSRKVVGPPPDKVIAPYVTTLKIEGSGAGQPPKELLQQELNPPVTAAAFPKVGAWINVAIFEDGKPRVGHDKSIFRLSMQLLDENKVPWPTLDYTYAGHCIVCVPATYDRVPKKLTLRVMEQQTFLKELDFPTPAAPKRVLTAENRTPSDGLKLVNAKGRDGNMTVQLHMPAEVPKEKYIALEVLAQTYGEVAPSSSPTRIRGKMRRDPTVLSYNASVVKPEEVKFRLTEYEAYDVQKTVVLGESALENRNGHPSLRPKPERVVIDPNLTLQIASFDPTYLRGDAIARTSSIVVNPVEFVDSFSVRLIGPKPEEISGVSFIIEGAKGNPPVLKKQKGFTFEAKPVPITFEVTARPFRKVSTKTYVLPVPR